MKKLKYISFLLFVPLAIAVFFACKKTPDMPPVKHLGGVYTITQLRALYAGSNIHFTTNLFPNGASLFATVTMTDNYKTLYIRDNTGAICLKQLTAHGIFEGDSLRIDLMGSWLDLTGTLGSLQIDSVDVSPSPTNKVVKLAVGKIYSPINVNIAQLSRTVSNVTYPNNTTIPLSMYDGALVQVNDVQFSLTDTGLFFPLVPPAIYASRNIYDCGAVNTLTVSLYTGTADFVNRRIPNTKSGSIIGAIAFYNGNLQITPRSFNDVLLTQPRCGVDTLTQGFENCNSGVISASAFATALPGWYNIAQVGNLIWNGAGSGSMAASNYGTITTRNVMWLITPPIQNNNPNKNVSFQTAVTFYSSTSKPRQLGVYISTDFNGYNFAGAHPATWTEITPLFDNLNNNFWQSSSLSSTSFTNASTIPVMLNTGNIAALNGYTGTFYIGFKYMSNTITADSSQTFAIDNFALLNN
jgi:hypothetical protein